MVWLVTPLTKSCNSTALYFEKSHDASPMMHRLPYMSSLRLPSAHQPPACLQHAIMAIGACTHPEYASMATPIYRRARALAEIDEMEVCQVFTYLSIRRSPMLTVSTGPNRIARQSVPRSVLVTVEAFGLRRSSIYTNWTEAITVLVCFTQFLPPQDWIELEERCRTWWLIHVADRLVFATSGLPAAGDDRQVGNDPQAGC